MTREILKDLLPIMQAFAKGKKIEFSNDGENWIETETPTWDTDFVYRIKPESKYRPFNTAEECWNEARAHKDFPWIRHVDGEFTQIKNIGKYKVKVEYSDHIRGEYQFDVALNTFTFTDGIPFGVNEEYN